MLEQLISKMEEIVSRPNTQTWQITENHAEGDDVLIAIVSVLAQFNDVFTVENAERLTKALETWKLMHKYYA